MTLEELQNAHDWAAVEEALVDLEAYTEEHEPHATTTIEEIRNTRHNLPEVE